MPRHRKRASRRGGRPRSARPRHPSGKVKQVSHEASPTPELLARRAAELGLPAPPTGTKAALNLMADPAAGTALGQLMWCWTGKKNKRTRRMLELAGIETEAITDDMAYAAERYREIWLRYYHLRGLPRRNPRGMMLEMTDGSAAALSPTPEEDPERAALTRKMGRLFATMRQAVTLNCSQPALALEVLDCVVIDNLLPLSLDSLEADPALLALREALEAIHISMIARRF
ncbi:MAG: hypothetical protein ACPGOY_18320 [Rhodospirillaceae bacterium]